MIELVDKVLFDRSSDWESGTDVRPDFHRQKQTMEQIFVGSAFVMMTDVVWRQQEMKAKASPERKSMTVIFEHYWYSLVELLRENVDDQTVVSDETEFDVH